MLRKQEGKRSLLLPDMIEDYVDENNPARSSYDPSDMLKLYLWGYYNGARS
jgi:hypothetical protein